MTHLLPQLRTNWSQGYLWAECVLFSQAMQVWFIDEILSKVNFKTSCLIFIGYLESQPFSFIFVENKTIAYMHTETMYQNSYKGFNQNQGKPGGIIHCCASVYFCFDLWRNCTVQTIALILVIVSVWLSFWWKTLILIGHHSSGI